MKKIEIITDEHRHHVYVGNTDFWLNTQELVELYKKLGATKEWRKRNREKYRAYQKEYWSKHYRNYGTKNRVADRAMRERKKPDVEKALSMFKNPQQAAHLAWLLENKKNNRS